jgi:hypothetical protein
MNAITSETYRAPLARFLSQQGPNQGSRFFGQWAWRVMKERALREALQRDISPPDR